MAQSLSQLLNLTFLKVCEAFGHETVPQSEHLHT